LRHKEFSGCQGRNINIIDKLNNLSNWFRESRG